MLYGYEVFVDTKRTQQVEEGKKNDQIETGADIT